LCAPARRADFISPPPSSSPIKGEDIAAAAHGTRL